jgi:hypothetical protein
MQAAAKPCREREALESQYHSDLKVYREAVAGLESPDEFDVPFAASELARVYLERAHTALKRHIAEHRCG